MANDLIFHCIVLVVFTIQAGFLDIFMSHVWHVVIISLNYVIKILWGGEEVV